MNFPAILILDASVLISFLRIDRTDLLARYPAKILITDHVVEEVTTAYSEQLARLRAAIAKSILEVIPVTEIRELETIARLQIDSPERLGIGECSAIAVAFHRNLDLAIDDTAAIKCAKAFSPNLRIHQTKDIMVLLIRTGIIDVAAADLIKDIWAQHHRFRLKLKTFAELL